MAQSVSFRVQKLNGVFGRDDYEPLYEAFVQPADT